MNPSTKNIETILAEAVEIVAPDERRAFVEQACGDDQELKRRVEQLIANHFQAGSFLERPAAAAMDSDRTAGWEEAGTAERPGTVIGPYTLLRVIGEGGMGVVYEAEQTAPVRRTVALKVIKPGMDTAAVLARFDAERQALALMDHPHIARVLDAGYTGVRSQESGVSKPRTGQGSLTPDPCLLTPDLGRPYFVMELVKGTPIAAYCDDARLTPRQRLELFIPVCQAIQHAHQKGIIHRDIKPSNVLVTVVDGRPAPKVIDFGVAKAIDQRQAERTLFTRLGAIVGTPEHMSPEQAGASPDIDTRTDIYSLGVLLYELLTGTTPLDRETLRQAGFDEVLKRVREEEPPKPSTRLSGANDRIPSVAAQRGTEPARLAKLVRGDIDWIVMKALDKDRTRRYETASALAQDIQRYLNGDPVEAGPPSAVYRVRKFARKHRAALATVVAFAVLLVLASVVSTLLMLRARSAERLAKERLSDLTKANAATTQALAHTRQAQAEARAEADKAKAINDFLTNDLLTQAEPANNSAEDHVSLLDVLDRAAHRVGDRFAGQPEVEDALRRAMAGTYHGLASWEKAERQWRAVLNAARQRRGPESPEALTALGQLAHMIRHRGRLDADALEMAKSASEGLARVLGPNHPYTLTSRNNLAVAYSDAGRTADAITLLEMTLKTRESKLGPDHPDTLTGRDNLAVAYLAAGRTADAIKLDEATLKLWESRLGPDHPDTLTSRSNLANAYLAAGRAAEAIKLHEATLKLTESRLGPDHPDTLISRYSLANAYLAAGRTAVAITLLEMTLKTQESKLGRDHPDTLTSRSNLAAAYLAAGRTADAIKMDEATLRLKESKLGPHHPSTLTSRNNLANAYLNAGRTAEAIKMDEATLKLMESGLGPDHPNTLASRNNLANAYLAAGRAAEAIKLHEATLKLRESRLGQHHPSTLTSRNNLAAAYDHAGRTSEAVKMHEQNLKLLEAKVGPDHPYTLTTRNNLATAYGAAGRTAEAIKLLETTLKLQESELGPDHPETLLTRHNVACAYLDTGRTADAIKLHEETLKVRESKLGPDHPGTLQSRNNLACDYLAAGRTSEAIALHEANLKLQEPKLGPDHPDTLSTRNNLARAYQDAGRLTDALPLFEDTLKRRKGKLGPDHPHTLTTFNNLARAYLGARRWADAETTARECLGIREKKQPDDWWRFHTMSQLGAALAGQKKFAEAEPLLLQGYDGLKAREAKIVASQKKKLAEAAARIVKLYEAWGKAEEAVDWRKKGDTAPKP
jgi:serine/threonine protein kinase/tetratricopeptide (TPR) repeat protein